MKILNYERFDVVNGFGTRSSIWFAGCDHMCVGCFSKHTWSYDKGQSVDLKAMISRDMSDDMIERDGISLLGGDPLFHKNRDGVLDLLKWFKETYPSKSVWLWTGYTLEQISNDETMCDIMKYVDVLIDGKFVEELKDVKLLYRGSSNQRIIENPLEELKK